MPLGHVTSSRRVAYAAFCDVVTYINDISTHTHNNMNTRLYLSIRHNINNNVQRPPVFCIVLTTRQLVARIVHYNS